MLSVCVRTRFEEEIIILFDMIQHCSNALMNMGTGIIELLSNLLS